MLNIQKMMQQAQEVQGKLAELQEKLKEIEVQGESGGGLVKVLMTCGGKVLRVDVDPSVLTGDKEMLEDLVAAAVNNAGEAKDKRIQEETEQMMSGLGLPEGTQLPF